MATDHVREDAEGKCNHEITNMTNQPEFGHADATAEPQSPPPGHKLSRRRKLLRTFWVLSLCLFIAGFIAVVLFADSTSRIDASGLLYEPLFWLIPVSYFFLFSAVILAVFDLALNFTKSR